MPPPTTCQTGRLNTYDPLSYEEDLGSIEGQQFFRNAENLAGKGVAISAQVMEAQYRQLPDGEDATYVPVAIPDHDGNSYLGIVVLPLDMGTGVDQFRAGSAIEASGRHLGYAQVPADLFVSFPNKQGYSLPNVLAMLASGGCEPGQ